MTTLEFDKKLKCGPEFVAVRILENCEDLKVGSIYLPQTAEANSRLAHVIVEDVGSTAAEKLGIKVGDYVMIDRLATFAHTAPVAALKYDSVICITDKNMSDYWPLKNMIFVKPDEKEAMTKVNNIFVPGSYDKKLNLGTIIKMNCEDELNLHFKVNDRVLLTKGADVVQVNQSKLFIYKHDMIIATVED